MTSGNGCCKQKLVKQAAFIRFGQIGPARCSHLLKNLKMQTFPQVCTSIQSRGGSRWEVSQYAKKHNRAKPLIFKEIG